MYKTNEQNKTKSHENHSSKFKSLLELDPFTYSPLSSATFLGSGSEEIIRDDQCLFYIKWYL